MDEIFDKISESEKRGREWTVRGRVSFGEHRAKASAGRWCTGTGATFQDALRNAEAEARSR